LALGVRRQAEELERQLMVAGRSGELLQPLVCGSGAFLAERVITASGIRCLPPAELSGMFVRNISVCAAAFATARLAAERCLDDLVPFSESGVFSGGLAAGN
jgi:uncharacterized hydantoinase/oxoprolinase family protein